MLRFIKHQLSQEEMTMSEYNPGMWTWSPPGWRAFNHDDLMDRDIVDMYGDAIACVFERGTGKENAALILAAPLMLSALRIIAGVEAPPDIVMGHQDIAKYVLSELEKAGIK